MKTVVQYQRPPIKVALMGLGRSMLADHYSVFKAHPALFKVAFACDLSKDRRDLVAKDFSDCKFFRQFSDMLDEPDIDLVDIATPTVDHVKHALMSLKRGFWTLLETPMAITYDDAVVLKGAAVKAKNRLIIFNRGMFDPDYLLAKQMLEDKRLGPIYEISMREEDYIRRDDWQCVKRLGGGAAYYAMHDMIIKILRMLPSPPTQMWSELKRIASLGDAEDFVHVNLKTRDPISANLEFSGGVLPSERSPSFMLRGELGVFKVERGSSVGKLTVVDPGHKFPRRRSSVRTPPIKDLHEEFPILSCEVKLQGNTPYGPSVFWKHVYDSVRVAAPFPIALEESIEAIKFVQLMKKNSPFGR